MAPLYLVLDQGGNSGRALVFDHQGRQLALASRPASTTRGNGGRVEQSPAELRRSLTDSLAEVLSGMSAADRDRIAGAALVTQRSSLVCWRKADGSPLSPVLSWQDTRAASLLDDLDLDREQLRRITGLVANAHYGASKMRWCLDNLPAVIEALDDNDLFIGPLAAWLCAALTGNARVEPGNGSRTLLMDIQSRQWHPKLLSAFGIPSSVLPGIVANRSCYGDISWDGQTIPLKLVNGDQCAAFHGNGPLEAGTAYINAGTGAFVATPLPQGRPIPPGLLKTPVYCDGKGCHYVCEGTVNGAASALDAMAGELGLDDYNGLDKWSGGNTGIPLFLNGIGGLGAPFWQPDFTSGFVGEGSPEAKMVSVAESIAFLLQVNMDAMAASGLPLSRILLSGGLARYQWLAQCLGALTGLPVAVADNPEATARGAAFQLAGFPDGWAMSAVPVPGADSAAAEAIRQRYARWRQLMPIPR